MIRIACWPTQYRQVRGSFTPSAEYEMRGETLVSTQGPFADRETTGPEAGRTKRLAQRQEERDARLATLAERIADDGDLGRPVRGLPRCYMARCRVANKVSLNNAECTQDSAVALGNLSSRAVGCGYWVIEACDVGECCYIWDY